MDNDLNIYESRLTHFLLLAISATATIIVSFAIFDSSLNRSMVIFLTVFASLFFCLFLFKLIHGRILVANVSGNTLRYYSGNIARSKDSNLVGQLELKHISKVEALYEAVNSGDGVGLCKIIGIELTDGTRVDPPLLKNSKKLIASAHENLRKKNYDLALSLSGISEKDFRLLQQRLSPSSAKS